MIFPKFYCSYYETYLKQYLSFSATDAPTFMRSVNSALWLYDTQINKLYAKKGISEDIKSIYLKWTKEFKVEYWV